jgi:IS5 family transposase
MRRSADTQSGEGLMKQTPFASMSWAAKGRVTGRQRFLAEMNAVIAWARLIALIEPRYPKAGGGRPPLPLERMLRVYFMQQWFNLSDPQAEDAIADETTILRFRHWLEKHRLTEAIFAEVRALLQEKRLLLKSGTIVDARIIAAPRSTRNAEGERDPEMHQTRKGKDWHFGMERDVSHGPEDPIHRRLPQTQRFDQRTVHELRHQPQDGVQVDRSLPA